MRGAVRLMSIILLAGCMRWTGATGDQLTRRASFDLDCGSNELRYLRIDARSQGVAGCGKHATYIESCDGQRGEMGTTCTWILNGSIEAASPPAPAPASAPAESEELDASH
jgi:hypothetical protein